MVCAAIDMLAELRKLDAQSLDPRVPKNEN
jgi:hypothetical protein